MNIDLFWECCFVIYRIGNVLFIREILPKVL